MRLAAPDDATQSGPAVARLFQRLLALCFLVAWLSLGVQLLPLIGSHGLLPAASWFAAARDHGIGFAQAPSFFWFGADDTVLTVGIWVGVVFASCALIGIYPRLCFACATLLYLSYATAARTFLSFQWDNLLLECGLLATLLPADRRARWVHVLFRVLLLKLYWESGIAKWQSYLGDWQDGSAMTVYYETAPLPTWLAWYAHWLPSAWHHFESHAVLALELALPVAIFGPLPVRLFAAVVFTGFQLLNIATANYGFFAYLSIALNLFLLSDELVRSHRHSSRGAPDSASAWIDSAGDRNGRHRGRPSDWLRGTTAALAVVAYVGISAADAWMQFGRPPAAWHRGLNAIRAAAAPWRLINTYHLFGHITRERVEPEFQILDGNDWRALELHHKPGNVARAPDFVAPHQPRLDFQLWFYGLDFRGGTPAYVATLLDRLCKDPDAVKGFFVSQLPSTPDAVRIVFWRYNFSTPEERRVSGTWWTRTELASTRALACR